MPFAAGPHKCVGEAFAWTEMLIIAAAVLARWRIGLATPGRVHETATSATLRPRGPQLRIHRRAGRVPAPERT